MRTVIKGAMLGALVVLTSACVTEEGPEGQDAEGAGYLVFDREAVDIGYAFDGYDAADLLMPIEIEPGEIVTIATAGDPLEVEIAAGDVVHVTETGLQHYRMGQDVAINRIVVDGDERSARRLARQVGGEYTTDDLGRFVVSGPHLYAELSAGWAPETMHELVPLVLDSADPFRSPTPAEPPQLLAPAELAAVGLQLAPKLVPESMPDPLAALRRAPVSCSDPIAGTWVSREFYQEHGDWYVFTLNIDRASGNLGKLTGTIDSRSWSGPETLAEPTECASLPVSNWGDGFDWTVQMEAEGSLRGKAVNFGGAAWSVASERCGRSPQTGNYNLDQFSGQIIDGQWLKAFNNDGGRSVNDPHTFRRMGCAK